MQVNGDDSDGDRVGDIAELLQGTDPNVPEGGPPPEEARYGCYCSAVGGLSASSGAGARVALGSFAFGLAAPPYAAPSQCEGNHEDPFFAPCSLAARRFRMP